MMIEVEGVLIHEEVLKEEFVCNLNACKGACCVEGDAGAPLEKNELAVLKEIYPAVKPYMTEKELPPLKSMALMLSMATATIPHPALMAIKNAPTFFGKME
jgi:hypothetical protein